MSQPIRTITLLYLMAGLACTKASSVDLAQLRAAPQNSPRMTVTEARMALQKALTLREHNRGEAEWMEGCDKRTWAPVSLTNFVNANDGVMYVDKGRFLRGDKNTPFSVTQAVRFDRLQFISVKECSMRGHFGVVWPRANPYIGGYSWANAGDAQLFVDAVNAIVSEYRGGGSTREAPELAEFRTSARAWRALSVKPTLPEETHRQRVLAENALEEKNIDAALSHYQAGLKVTPLWPQGHFNVAYLHAEMGNFFFAVEHMRRYLELVPNASDAEAMRDRVIIWENKIPMIKDLQINSQPQKPSPLPDGARRRI